MSDTTEEVSSSVAGAAPTQSPLQQTPPPSPSPLPPTTIPTKSISPSGSPTSPVPSSSPTGFPSAHPSEQGLIYIEQGYTTQLFVAEQRYMTKEEKFFFDRIMESHTDKYGHFISTPFIQTQSEVLKQIRGVIPSTTSSTQENLLQVQYSMSWSSRYGYELTDYPTEFLAFINANANGTYSLLMEGFETLPYESFVTGVGSTVLTDLDDIVPDPTPVPTMPPALITPNPTIVTPPPTVGATSESPSDAPSSLPTIVVNVPPVMNDERSGYLIGVVVALVVVALATAVVVSLRFYKKRAQNREDGAAAANTDNGNVSMMQQQQKKQDDNNGNVAVAVAAAQDQFSGGVNKSLNKQYSSRGDGSSSYNKYNNNDVNASFGVPVKEVDTEAGINRAIITPPETAQSTTRKRSGSRGGSSGSHFGSSVYSESKIANVFGSDMAQKGLVYPGTIDSMISVGPDPRNKNDSGKGTTAAAANSVESPARDSAMDGTFAGANLIAARSESFSSNSLDDTISSQTAGGESAIDEFDRYKNQVLEKLRAEVESNVANVESMLGLAITRIFMDPEDDKKPFDMSWTGGGDLGSIEATCLCQSYEFDKTSVAAAAERTFFEEMVNKIVYIVHHGLIRPQDGARILHSSASIIGLPLIRKLRGNTLIVQGLVKSNDLALGHHMLVQTFSPFGDIVDASIAPQNRGFGFVRFVQTGSIEEVLKRHHTTAIEIQDVNVTIKAL